MGPGWWEGVRHLHMYERELKAHSIYHNEITETCVKRNVIKRTHYPEGFAQANEHKANTNI